VVKGARGMFSWVFKRLVTEYRRDATMEMSF